MQSNIGFGSFGLQDISWYGILLTVHLPQCAAHPKHTRAITQRYSSVCTEARDQQGSHVSDLAELQAAAWVQLVQRQAKMSARRHSTRNLRTSQRSVSAQ
jgi:hypothetical protein